FILARAAHRETAPDSMVLRDGEEESKSEEQSQARQRLCGGADASKATVLMRNLDAFGLSLCGSARTAMASLGGVGKAGPAQPPAHSCPLAFPPGCGATSV